MHIELHRGISKNKGKCRTSVSKRSAAERCPSLARVTYHVVYGKDKSNLIVIVE